jgi:hypothetical protein
MQNAGCTHRSSYAERKTSTLCIYGIVILGLGVGTAELAAGPQPTQPALTVPEGQWKALARLRGTTARAIKPQAQLPSFADSGEVVHQVGVFEAPRSRRIPGMVGLSPPACGWIASFTVALGLSGCVYLAMRRCLPPGVSANLKIVGRVSLSPKHAVYLVQIGRRMLLIATGPQGAPAFISEFDDPSSLARNAEQGDKP